MKLNTQELILINEALFEDDFAAHYANWPGFDALRKKFSTWDGYYFKVKDAGSFNDGDIILQIWNRDGLVSQFYVNRDRDPLEIVKKLEVSAGNTIRDGREL